MKNVSRVGMLAVVAFGATLALPSQAGEVPTPSQVTETGTDKTDQKKAKAAAGTPTMPSKGPSSVSESAPQKTGKEPPAPMSKGDSKNLPNPKTPSSVSESAPQKAADKDKK